MNALAITASSTTAGRLLDSPSDLYRPTDSLATHRASLHLPGARLAGTDVPTGIEQRVHLLLVAHLAKLHLVLRVRIVHRALPITLALLEAALKHVAPLGIRHLSLPVRLVVLPVALVNVLIRIDHLPRAGFLAADERSIVGVATHGD